MFVGRPLSEGLASGLGCQMATPKLTSLSEVHRGREHLLHLTIEVDIVEAPDILSEFNVEMLSGVQIADVVKTAKQVADARKAESDAQATADAKAARTTKAK